MKKWIAEAGCGDPNSDFMESDWLKWIQASFYDVEKAGVKLMTHIEWSKSISHNPKLTDMALRLL